MIVLCMTGITIDRSALVIVVRMTTGASCLNVGTSQLEGSLVVVIKAGYQPTAGFVTCPTVCAELTIVMIFILMTSITTGRSAIEYIINMAGSTGHLNVFAGQFEGCQIVIECRWEPGTGRMASSAVCAELTIVMIVLRMAGVASGGSAPVYIVGVTTGTWRLEMCTGQIEGCQAVVVIVSREPGAGRVARTTTTPELSIMRIVLLMTDVACSRSAQVHFIDMAIGAVRLNMFASQFEDCQGMVEGCRQPAIGDVTCTACGAEPGCVGIGFRMTANAICWCSLKNTIHVTVKTENSDMFPGQLEGKKVMVEGGWQPTSDLMTDGTILTILTIVFIIFLVTRTAVGRYASIGFVYMTTLTWRSISLVAGGTIDAKPFGMRIILFMARDTFN
jgi:hypothetical protein